MIPAALSDAALGGLVIQFDHATSVPQYRLALRLAIYTLARPSELLAATWPDVNLATGQWLVPHTERRSDTFAARSVPLPKQAIELFGQLQELQQARARLQGDATPCEWIVPGVGAVSRQVEPSALGKVLVRACEAARRAGAPLGVATLVSLRQSGQDWLLDQTDEPGLLARVLGSPLPRAEARLASYNPARNPAGQGALLQAWADHVAACEAKATK